MNSNTESQFSNDIEEAIKLSKSEYDEMTNDKFNEQIQKAINKSKEEFNNNLSNIELDQIDNFGESSLLSSSYLRNISDSEDEDEESDYNIKIKILPLSMYPWDDNIVDYLETTNNFIGTQDILKELNRNNLLENTNIISFKFDDSNILSIHEFIIGDTCFIPSNIFNDLHKKNIITYDDKQDSYLNITFMNKKFDVGSSVIFETKNIDFIKIKDQKKLCEENIIEKIKIINIGQKFYFFSKELNNYIEFICKNTNTGREIIITDTDLEITMTINETVLKEYHDKIKELESHNKEKNNNSTCDNPNNKVIKSDEKKLYNSKNILDDSDNRKVSISASELRQRRVKFYNKKITTV